jgi:hypothetical protein
MPTGASTFPEGDPWRCPAGFRFGVKYIAGQYFCKTLANAARAEVRTPGIEDSTVEY